MKNMSYEEVKAILINNLDSELVKEIKHKVEKCNFNHLLELCFKFLEAKMNDDCIDEIIVLGSGDCSNIAAIFIHLIYNYISEDYDNIKEFSLAFYNLMKNYCAAVISVYPEFSDNYKTLINVLATMQKTFNIESNFNRMVLYSQYLVESDKNYNSDRLGLNISKAYLESLLGSDIEFIKN